MLTYRFLVKQNYKQILKIKQMKSAEEYFNNGFGKDVQKVHRNHVIELMANFAKYYHTEQLNFKNKQL